MVRLSMWCSDFFFCVRAHVCMCVCVSVFGVLVSRFFTYPLDWGVCGSLHCSLIFSKVSIIDKEKFQ